MNQPVRCVLAVKDGFLSSVDGVVQYGFHMSAYDECNMCHVPGRRDSRVTTWLGQKR